MYVWAYVSALPSVRVVTESYIDLAILKPLLQIIVDCLVGYFTDQGEIRNSYFLLLRGIESRLSDNRLLTCTGLRIACVLVALGPPTDTLNIADRSVQLPPRSPIPARHHGPYHRERFGPIAQTRPMRCKQSLKSL